MTLLPFFLLAFAFLSVWVRRDPRIWGSLLILSLLSALSLGILSPISLLILLGWAALWFFYARHRKFPVRIALFALLVVLPFGFVFHWFPGFHSLPISGKFAIQFDGPMVGFFPLALFVPLASSARDWKLVWTKGLWLSCLGIGVMALLAIATGTTHWELKLPPAAGLRYFNNLALVAIPQEAFYRGFVQRELSGFLQNTKKGKLFALFFSSFIFALIHLYWSPNLTILGFTFIAGLLYGGVYLLSGKIESAILCHFLLNFIHMTFFNYHAM